MPLIYITGIEAAGKSTICNALKERGCEAYDIDHGIAYFCSIVTGKKAKPADAATKRTDTWYNQHIYMMDRTKVAQYREQAKDKPIFLCGTTRSDFVVIDLFDTIVYLYLDEATLKKRLQARKDFEFGHAPHEQAMILNWREPTENDYRDYGAVMIDATKSIETVIGEILTLAKA